MRGAAHRWISCLVLILVHTRRICANSSSSASVESSTGALVKSDVEGGKEAQVAFVQLALSERLNYVLRGKRMHDFRGWVDEQGGNPKVFSMHGIDVDVQLEIDESQNMDLEVNILPPSKVKRHDPFPSDRMNLNIDSADGKIFYPMIIDKQDGKTPTALQLSLRAGKLSLQFAPVLTTAWIAALSKNFRRGIWYKWVASCLASSGAAFIKWGQWAATRNDMFPQALCDALSNLHSDAPAHSWDFTQKQVEKSLNIPPGCLFDVFKSFDEKPLASGSIAQVHKAELFDGQVVAAKVRHPSVSQLIDMDFRLMTMVSKLFDQLPSLKGLRVSDSVAQFSHTMAAQAHLNVEAHHLEVLNHNFRNWQTVRFPQPFYASSSLILETFEQGQIVTGILDAYDEEARSSENVAAGHDLIPLDEAKFLVTTGVSLYLKMLLIDNLMHADLHPGNIMLRGFDGFLHKPKLQITLVDAGMVAQLSDEESSNFIGLLTSIGEGDGVAAAEFALQFSSQGCISEESKAKFKEKMSEYFRTNCRGYGTNVDIGEVLRGVLGLVREHHIRIDANYATLVINVLCVESLGRRICPSYNVLDASKPLLQTYRRVVYKDNGYSPRATQLNSKRVKRLMPAMLYGTKQRADNDFFRRIEVSRRETNKINSN